MKAMKNLLLIAFVVSALLCGGCSSLYKSTVTFTEVVDAGMKSWAALSVKGRTTPAIDERVIKAHATYQKSAAVARDALIAYKAGGDKKAYEQALAAVGSAVAGILDIISPILTATQATDLRVKASKASTL